MVRAFHRAGLEVILDVVFNHAAEGDEWGPTLCFRGIDNDIFYTLANDKRHYQNFTGTGNPINANQPVVKVHPGRAAVLDDRDARGWLPV